jgi:ABC-2 type transport system ATP-binding protein
LAASHGLGSKRVDELLDLVGLAEVARKRVGAFSLGMGQRLGIAAALLGDPAVLLFDEPANGLDPEGIRWIRQLLRRLAAEGRTVFVSSHVMSEMALTADHLVVIGRGRLIADMPVDEFVRRGTRHQVRVRSPRVDDLVGLISGPDVTVHTIGGGAIEIDGMTSDAIGDLAAKHRIPLHELTPLEASLEEAFMEVTGGSVEYHAEGAR